MADLDGMLTKISERERNNLKHTFQEEKEKISKEKEAAKEKVEEQFNDEKDKILKALNEEFSMKSTTLDVQQRNAILREKQQIIQQVLKDALSKLENISSDHFMHIVMNALENVDVQEQYIKLFIGEKTQKQFDEAVLQDALPTNHQVHVQDKPVQGEGGLIVRVDNVDYNYLFERLITENMQNFLPYLTMELFGE